MMKFFARNRRFDRAWHFIAFVFGFVLIGWAGLLPDRASAATIYSGSLDGTSTTMTDRIFRDSVQSTCASAKMFPGTSTGTNIQYNVIPYVHTGPARCVTFTYSTGSCAATGFLSIYNNTFDPANKATNYLADIGSSSVGNKAAINMTTGQTIQLVLNGTAAGLNCTVSIESDDPSTVGAGALDATAPTMAGRPFRDAIPSTCAAVKSYPGLQSPASTYQYRTISYTNTGPARCVSFTQAGGTCNVSMFLSVYSGAFNPGSQATNYLGDAGSSGLKTKAGIFMTAGQTVNLLVNGTSSGLTCSFIINADSTGTVAGAPHDFDGDGKSDILWRSSAGDAVLWLMNAATLSTNAGLGNVGAAWTPVAQRDFSGDAKTDILWRDTAGNVAMWLMNGATVASVASFGNIGANWNVAASGDFNGDGKGDIIWRDTAGNTAIWLMNGTTATSVASLGNVPTDWSVVAAADFNGDGKSDLVWRNTAGDIVMWLMNGTSASSVAGLGNIATNWSVAGTADFNGDGKGDIIWRSNTGDTVMWLMNGAAASQVAGIGNVDPSWTVASNGDYNGDGKGDILWRNTAGENYIWFMNGPLGSSVSALSPVATNWSIQNASAN